MTPTNAKGLRIIHFTRLSDANAWLSNNPRLIIYNTSFATDDHYHYVFITYKESE